MKSHLSIILLSGTLMFLAMESKTNRRKCLRRQPVKSSASQYKAASAFYNHFIVDDITAPGRVWNEEFTSGIR